MLAKLCFTLWRQVSGKHKDHLLKAVREYLGKSLESNGQCAGSLLLQKYTASMEGKTAEQIDQEIIAYINGHPPPLHNLLQYYYAKLAKDGMLGENRRNEAERLFEEAAAKLPDISYWKGKVLMYVGFLSFDRRDVYKEKQFFLSAFGHFRARTKELFTKLFKLQLISDKLEQKELNIIGDLNLPVDPSGVQTDYRSAF